MHHLQQDWSDSDYNQLHKEASCRNVQYFENLKSSSPERDITSLHKFVTKPFLLNNIGSYNHQTATVLKYVQVETTALHRVVGLYGCVSSEDEENALKCAKILIRDFKVNVNDFDGKYGTPLHLALANRMETLTSFLLSEGAYTWLKSKKEGRYCLAADIAIEFPDMMRQIFDASVIESPINKECIRLEWRSLIPYPALNSDRSSVESVNIPDDLEIEMAFLHSVIDGDNQVQRKLLTHPLVQAFLHLRKKKYWLRFGTWYYALKMIYFAMYIAFVSKLYLKDCPYQLVLTEDGNIENLRCTLNLEVKVLAYVIAVMFTCLQLPIELRTLKTDRRYLKTWQNWIFILSSIVVGVTIWPPLTLKQSYNIRWQYPYAAMVAMCLSLWCFLIQLGTIPKIASFINMIFQVIKTVVIVCIVFLPILGYFFGLQLMFAASFGGFLQMAVIGEDYKETVTAVRNADESTVQILTAYVFCATLIALMTIVFANFLLGRAVNDIQRLYRCPVLSHRASEIRQYYHVDKFGGEFFNSFAVVLIKGLRKKRRKDVDKIWILDVHQNGQVKFDSATPGQVTTLPGKIMKDLLDIVRSKSSTNNSDNESMTTTRENVVPKDFQSSSMRFPPLRKSFATQDKPYHPEMKTQEITDLRNSVKLLLNKMELIEKKISAIQNSIKDISDS